ncbi:hypothetical protein FRC02_011869 [Tulasnella sp. 418]|nr:hypothetical protein FRC02_011869 [Tulasnella sp. 418]
MFPSSTSRTSTLSAIRLAFCAKIFWDHGGIYVELEGPRAKFVLQIRPAYPEALAGVFTHLITSACMPNIRQLSLNGARLMEDNLLCSKLPLLTNLQELSLQIPVQTPEVKLALKQLFELLCSPDDSGVWICPQLKDISIGELDEFERVWRFIQHRYHSSGDFLHATLPVPLQRLHLTASTKRELLAETEQVIVSEIETLLRRMDTEFGWEESG